MSRTVLIAHAKNEEDFVEKLAQPLREAGYDVAHQGTVLVGESEVETTERLLEQGVPVVLCGTERAAGNVWVKRLVHNARQINNGMLFIIQMESGADVDSFSFGEKIGFYWKDPHNAIKELVAALNKYCPLQVGDQELVENSSAERRYRDLLLEACDIINLANLPEQDRHIAQKQQELKLRGLYIPLRVQVEISNAKGSVDAVDDHTLLESLEQRRTISRQFRPSGERIPVGKRLAQARRLVVLGDPGSGKTTLTRWIATAYLLRLKQDDDWKELPDIKTLPEANWLPIIVRCRGLDAEALTGSLDDILKHVLKKSELLDSEATAVRTLLKKRLKNGQAILMLDGLDEITDPAARAGFCQQLDQIVVAYPDTPIIATSRIVGYREMGYKLTRGFEHVTLADLIPQEKDDFAVRWCSLTEIPERRQSAAEELIHDIHSAERIERLTGNPMLLTTMALVKRKVGKLPNRRAELYWEAVQVLLNWRREVDEPLDSREAIPQLEYLAYSMCDRGVQQVRQDEILELLNRMREEYPNVHAVRNRTPEEFLNRLEARTAILVEAGYVRYLGMLVRVYEFRHLTFQEYLAARALVDGRFPGRNQKQNLAQHVAPLAGRTMEMTFTDDGPKEAGVVENWREAIRLCTAICNDDDVDDVLRAIVNVAEGEPTTTARARAILAALCLVDEPNASVEVAEQVIQKLAQQIMSNDGDGSAKTGVDMATMALASTRWTDILKKALLNEYRRRDTLEKFNPASLSGMVGILSAPTDLGLTAWLTERARSLTSENELEVIQASLNIAELAFQERGFPVPGMIDALMHRLTSNGARSYAAGMALYWLHHGSSWSPTEAERQQLLPVFNYPEADTGCLAFLCTLIAKSGDAIAADTLLSVLNSSDYRLRGSACMALADCNDPRAIDPLITCLADNKPRVRWSAAYALGKFNSEKSILPLIDRLKDENDDVRVTTIEALGAVARETPDDSPATSTDMPESSNKKAAIDHLITLLSDEDSEIRSEAVTALGETKSKQAVQPLIALLKDPDTEVRRSVVEALGNLRHEDAVEPLMANLLDDASFSVQHAAASAIEKIGGTSAIPSLLAAFASHSLSRGSIGRTLASLMNEAIESELIKLLYSEDAELRLDAINLLSRAKSERAIPDLIKCMSDTAHEVRTAATYALGDFNTPATCTALVEALKEEDVNLKLAACHALAGLNNSAALAPLMELLESSESQIRSSAARALGTIKAETAVDALIACLNDSDGKVVNSAGYALGRIGEKASPHLEALFQHSKSEVRQSVVQGLAQDLDDHDKKLLSRDLDGRVPFLDPQNVVSELFAYKAAQKLKLTIDQVKARYAALAERFQLKFEWPTA